MLVPCYRPMRSRRRIGKIVVQYHRPLARSRSPRWPVGTQLSTLTHPYRIHLSPYPIRVNSLSHLRIRRSPYHLSPRLPMSMPNRAPDVRLAHSKMPRYMVSTKSDSAEKGNALMVDESSFPFLIPVLSLKICRRSTNEVAMQWSPSPRS